MNIINTTTESNFSSSDSYVNTSAPHDSAFDEKVNQLVHSIVIIMVLIVMLSLGCTMEISKIKEHLVKPKGVAIAAVAQYGIMPLTAFCLGKLFRLNPIESVTVLICGCCPGGSLSNFCALILQGDMNLSIVMTSCSTVLALGLMPLMIFLYCQGFSDLQHAVPYAEIVISLILILLPCGLGILINYCVPQYSKIITKVGVYVMVISAVVLGVVAAVTDGKRIFQVTAPPLLATAALMPLTGFICGYFLSALFRMNASCRRTVSVETGCQNIHLCLSILKVAFPAEVIGQLYLFPAVYIVFQVLEALFFTALFRCHQRLRPSNTEMKVYRTVNGAAEENTEAL